MKRREGISTIEVLMAILIIASTFTVLANLLADIAYGLLDPRVRFS